MPSDNSTLGRCPDCGASIPNRRLLIEYETEDGDASAYAECPDCDEVVTPEA
jgi:uncharacterized C2H2 Zn-finger protein